jgi:hypothetical protein
VHIVAPVAVFARGLTPSSRALIVSALFAAAAVAAPAHAQQWGGPLFSSPLHQPRFEVLTFDTDGAGVGIAAAVLPFASAPDLRIRAGIMDGYGTGPFELPSYGLTRRRPVAYMAGIDYSRPLSPDATGPVRASLVAGVGVGVNAATVVTAPLGISIGYDGGRVRPYMTPRVVLEHTTSSARPWENGTRLRGLVDWGVDVDLPIGGTLRAAVTTGSYNGVGIGFSF